MDVQSGTTLPNLAIAHLITEILPNKLHSFVSPDIISNEGQQSTLLDSFSITFRTPKCHVSLDYGLKWLGINRLLHSIMLALVDRMITKG